MSESEYIKLYQKLPEPYAITPAQINASYQSLYDKISDALKNNDFNRIYNLFYCSINSSGILSLKIHQYDDKNTFLADFVNLIYSIITIYPVKNYKTQLIATNFLNCFLEKHKTIPNLVLNWKPYYKVMKYFTISKESFFIRGNNLPKSNNDNKDEQISYFLQLSHKISQYFPDEIELEINGQKILTNTTEQLLKKFLPKISPNGHKTPAYLSYFCGLCPPHKGRYKLFIDQLLIELRDTTYYQCTVAILLTLQRTVECNIEDNFSYLIPVLSQFIITHIIYEEEFNYRNKNVIFEYFHGIVFPDSFFSILAKLLTALFISPPTRKAVIELFQSIFISLKSKIHPSNADNMFSEIDLFSEMIPLSLQNYLKKLTKKKEKKMFFDMKEELGPTQDEIHQFLSITSEMRIMNIRKCLFSFSVLIETTLDPSTIDHYFDIAYQCIKNMDAEDVSISGWNILKSLMMSIEKSEKIRENFEEIFVIASENLYRVELMSFVSNFLRITFCKVPFNKKDALKGLENLNYANLASLLINNLLRIFRSLPVKDGEAQITDSKSFNKIMDSINFLFANCDEDVIDELVPIFCSLASDEDLIYCGWLVRQMVTDICFYIKSKHLEQIHDAFKKQIELRKQNSSVFSYLSQIYSIILPTNLLTVESVKKTTDYLIQFTKSDDEKIRKDAWKAISSCLISFNNFGNSKVTLKPEKMISNSFENSRLENYQIEWNQPPILLDLEFEIFDPIYEKLLSMKDPHEISKYLEEVGDSISEILGTKEKNSEGSIDSNEVNEFYINPFHFVPEVCQKSVPIKDKFIKCALRIIKEFPENDHLISRIIEICKSIFYVISKEELDFMSQYFISFDHSKTFYNRVVCDNQLCSIFFKRRRQIIIPITDDINELINAVVELGNSKYSNIRDSVFDFLDLLIPNYNPLINSIFEKMFDKISSIPFNEFVNFLDEICVPHILQQNHKLLCKIMIVILKNLNLDDKKQLDDLKLFMNAICFSEFTSETPKLNKQEFVDLLNEIEENYLNKYLNNRTYNHILILIIYVSLKYVYDVSNTILEFIMKNVTHFDEEISVIAEICLSNVLERRAKFTKEKINVTKYPTIADMPNILDRVTVKFNDNGVYFPLTLQPENEKENSKDIAEEEEEEFIEKGTDEIDFEYSLDINPTSSFEMESSDIEVNQEVIKIFDSFKDIEIEWKKGPEEENRLFNSNFMFSPSNGFFLYKDHYNQRKYEFTKNKFLLENIPNIMASASNSINEKNLNKGVRYYYIWKFYSLIVGPYCTKTLNKLCIKYLSQFYSINSMTVAQIVYDIVDGFLNNIYYWNIEERIKFFKLVALPVIFILSSNPNTSIYASKIIFRKCYHINPFCFAPLIKVLFILSPSGPNLQVYNRSLTSIVTKEIISMRPFHFFNSFNQFKEKFVTPFIKRMSEYKSNEIKNIIELVFSFLYDLSFSNKKSPLYSNEIEIKKKIYIDLLDEILSTKIENNNNKVMFHVFTSILNSFNQSSYYSSLLVAPLIIKNIHNIFVVLNHSKNNEEEQFIKSIGEFIENIIFFANTELEFNFVSVLVKELMNSSLPLQLVLLENLHKMLEKNIFNIPKNDFLKYEKIFLEYGHFSRSNNMGNDLRMKIAKILGFFEIRINNLEDKNQYSIEDEILKAASVILNSYLFDHGDDRVTNAFNLLEENCSSKKSKDKQFFKNVLEIFIHRHTDHVLNEVEDLIIQYKSLLAPSYIC